MLIGHAPDGLPLIRTRTGSGFRQACLMEVALEALTRIKGLTPRIFMTALKRIGIFQFNLYFASGERTLENLGR